MDKEIHWIAKEENAWNEWMNEYERENDDSDFLGAL